MGTTNQTMDECRLAEEIVSVLDPAVLRVCSQDRDVICYAVRSQMLKLQSVTLNRAALRRLLSDPSGAVKIDYLKRDLLRSAPHRGEFSYPRRSAIAPKADEARTFAGVR
jgi:hypothetical protein